MQIHYLQHVPFEGLGSIEQWIRARQYHLTATRLYHDDPLPRVDSIDNHIKAPPKHSIKQILSAMLW